jgi:hypothetical protein
MAAVNPPGPAPMTLICFAEFLIGDGIIRCREIIPRASFADIAIVWNAEHCPA